MRNGMSCAEASQISGLYLAGSLDPERAAEFAEHLESCPSCARDHELDAQLRQSVLASDVDTARIHREVRQRIGRTVRIRRFAIAAGLAAAAALAIFKYPSFRQPDPVASAAAQDHQREVVDHERRNWISEPAGIEALAARQGIAASELASISQAGYTIEHAKLCRLNGKIYLHLVYLSPSREFSVFLRPPDSARVSHVQIAGVGDECVAKFETPRVDAVVVTAGSTDAAEIALKTSALL